MAYSPETLRPGTYLVLEGGEGVGKSVQSALLATRGNAQLTRETGGTYLGTQIREILHSVDTAELSDLAEMFLIAADRSQHISEVVRPRLAAGRAVVSDRNWLSTVAYQGYGRGLSIDEVIMVTKMATQELFLPTRMFLLEAPDEVVALRMAGRELDRFERAGSDFHKRVKDGYNALAEEYGVVRIDVDCSPETAHKKIWKKCGDLILNPEEV